MSEIRHARPDNFHECRFLDIRALFFLKKNENYISRKLIMKCARQLLQQ